MRVLVACEFSGRVRDAFSAQGHDAISCDIIPSTAHGAHLQCDVREIDLLEYDLVIAHPPCTYLAVSGNRAFAADPVGRGLLRDDALELVRWFMSHDMPMCIENPIGVISTRIRKPDQIVEPYFFGHPYTKATCLWLNKLPPLAPTDLVTPGRGSYGWRSAPGDRARRRSLTFQGLAEAMASQWVLTGK